MGVAVGGGQAMGGWRGLLVCVCGGEGEEWRCLVDAGGEGVYKGRWEGMSLAEQE